MPHDLFPSGVFASVGQDASASRGTLIAPDAAAHTLGAWTQIIASTARPTDGFWIFVSLGSAADYLFNVGIGGAGSEQTIAANLFVGCGTGTVFGNWFYIPLPIPSGTRIAIQCQAAVASATGLYASLILGAYNLFQGAPFQRLTTYGANTADSGGISVDPGGVAHTKGAYSQIISSTTNPIYWLGVALGNAGNTIRTAGQWLIDIAIGGAGSEQIILPDIRAACMSSHDVIEPQFMWFPVHIPASTRLAVRAQSTITDATDRLFDAILYGLG